MSIIKTEIGNIRKLNMVILLLIGLVLLAGSCTSENGEAPAEEAPAPAKTQKKYIIAMSQPTFADSWRSTFNEEMKTAVEAYPEFELILLNGGRDNSKQNSDILSLIESEVDVIMVSPNEAKPLTAVIKKAYEQGIPIILIDRRIDGEYYTQYIGGDNELIGKMAGQWVANHLGEQGGNVVEIMGTIGTSAQIERHIGFIEAISVNPNIKVIDSKPADWTRDIAIDVMEDMLQAHAQIDVVYAHNDFSALGAYTAAEHAGRQDEMVFIGIDALPTPDSGIVGVMEGKIDVTYLYPTGAKEAIESCRKLLLDGEKLEKELKLGTIEITADNVQEVYDMMVN